MGTTRANRAHSIFKVKALGKARIIVFDTQDLTLGRSPENDVAIEDVEISRRHVVFSRGPEGCTVADQGTSNGTLVNGQVVAQARLSAGDVIQVGEVEITYAETTRNPASISGQIEYASQLKDFQSPISTAAGADGEATILGLMDAVAPGSQDEFEIRPAGDFEAYDVHAPGDPGPEPRNLDLEIDGPGGDGLDDLDLDGEPPAAAPGRATRQPDTAVSTQVWDLDEAPDGGNLALTLEVEGLEGEIRRVVEGLIGKTLELPALRIRIKGDDLG